MLNKDIYTMIWALRFLDFLLKTNIGPSAFFCFHSFYRIRATSTIVYIAPGGLISWLIYKAFSGLVLGA